MHARLIMPNDAGSIMNIMRMNTGMFCDMFIEHTTVKCAACNAFNESIENLEHGYPVEYAIEHMKTMPETNNACN